MLAIRRAVAADALGLHSFGKPIRGDAMDEKQTWETPEFEPLTESESRADRFDVPVRIGGSIPG